MKQFLRLVILASAMGALGACNHYTDSVCSPKNAVDLPISGFYKDQTGVPADGYIFVKKTGLGKYEMLGCTALDEASCKIEMVSTLDGKEQKQGTPFQMRSCKIGNKNYLETTLLDGSNIVLSQVVISGEARCGEQVVNRHDLTVNYEAGKASGMLPSETERKLQNQGHTPEELVANMQLDGLNNYNYVKLCP